jgi:hypothetical protein
VRIDDAALAKELSEHAELYSAGRLPPDWAQHYHFRGSDEATAQYVFVLDALNFCFWPLEGYEYEHLASTLKRALEADPDAFAAARLAALSEEQLCAWLRAAPGQRIPLAAERARLVREVGRELARSFGGSAATMIRSAGRSAVRLVQLVTAHFPGFRDGCALDGRQLFFYKRAQILVGDLWGAFKGVGLGEFTDMQQLTCFPDYRIPQLLRALGILRYEPALAAAVDAREELPAGGAAEVEIRAATVQAVERMVAGLRARGVSLAPFQLDWLLWERGERLLRELAPHHRVLTVFY